MRGSEHEIGEFQNPHLVSVLNIRINLKYKKERIVISAQEEFYPCEEDNIIENTQKMYFFYLTYT